MKIRPSWFVIAVVLFGLLIRLYLAVTLPLWHDEAYTLWASSQPFMRILTGATDPVHPPGYYLIIALISRISNHLYSVRASSLVGYLFNCFLLFTIAHKFLSKRLGFFLLSSYALSGYFIIFDWQVRMYTGTTSLILLSLLTMPLTSPSKPKMILWACINAIGLLYDYSFYWYFLPACLYFVYQSLIKKRTENLSILYPLFTSLLLSSWWYPFLFIYFRQGIKGIEWIQGILSPFFILSYFLGSHQNLGFEIVALGLAGIGAYRYYRSLAAKQIKILMYAGLLSFTGTYILSLLRISLFHLRSLQIIGLIIIFLFAFALEWVWIRSKLLTIALIVIQIWNIWTIAGLLQVDQSTYLLSFFPWKKIVEKLPNVIEHEVAYYIPKELPTPLLEWGLQYTLNGNERWPQSPITYKKLASRITMDQCKLINQSLIILYLCSK